MAPVLVLPRSALGPRAALEGLEFTPPAGFHGNATLSLNAASEGVTPLRAQLSSPTGSSPSPPRPTVVPARSARPSSTPMRPPAAEHDRLRHPRQGVETITPTSPLPAIQTSVLIDGFSQPGFAGTPLIALGGQSPGSWGTLAVSGGNVTIRGLAVGGVTIEATAPERLIAVVQAQGLTTELSLLDAQGHVLVRSDGALVRQPGSRDPGVSRGWRLFAGIGQRRGPRRIAWTTMLTPASPPLQPIPVGSPLAAVNCGGRFHRRRPHRSGRGKTL